MAKVTVMLPDDLMERFSNLADNTDRIIDSCLEAGGEVALGIVREGLAGVIGKNTKLPSRSTGELYQLAIYNSPTTHQNPASDFTKFWFSSRSRSPVSSLSSMANNPSKVML